MSSRGWDGASLTVQCGDHTLLSSRTLRDVCTTIETSDFIVETRVRPSISASLTYSRENNKPQFIIQYGQQKQTTLQHGDWSFILQLLEPGQEEDS